MTLSFDPHKGLAVVPLRSIEPHGNVLERQKRTSEALEPVVECNERSIGKHTTELKVDDGIRAS